MWQAEVSSASTVTWIIATTPQTKVKYCEFGLGSQLVVLTNNKLYPGADIVVVLTNLDVGGRVLHPYKKRGKATDNF